MILYIELPRTYVFILPHGESLKGARNVFDKRARTNFERQYVEYYYVTGQKLNYVLNINLLVFCFAHTCTRA